MEKKEYLVEITYHESGDSEVTTLKTDDLAWSMNQYQRNRRRSPRKSANRNGHRLPTYRPRNQDACRKGLLVARSLGGPV